MSNSIRIGVQLSHVDSLGNQLDNSGTMYYGDYDPETHVEYTYVKVENGSRLMMKTENTETVKDFIDNLVRITTEDGDKTIYPQLKFRLMMDPDNNITNWNDKTEDMFKAYINAHKATLSPIILSVKDVEIGRMTMIPFVTERTVVTDFVFTPNRSFRNLGDLIVELFRKITKEYLAFSDSFFTLFTEGLTEIDKLYAKDNSQDEDIIRITNLTNRWDFTCNKIREIIKDNIDLFKKKHKRVDIDLNNYPANTLCEVQLYSTEERDLPVIWTNILSDVNLVSLTHTSTGSMLSMNTHKNYSGKYVSVPYPPANDPSASVELAKNTDTIFIFPGSHTHTIRIKGGRSYIGFTSAESLQYKVIRTVPLDTSKAQLGQFQTEMRKQSKDVYWNDFTNKSEYREPYKFEIGGDPGGEGLVGYIDRYLWRSNNKGSWGSGSKFQYYRVHEGSGSSGNFSGWRDETPSEPFYLSDKCQVHFKSVTDRGNFDQITSHCMFISITNGKSLTITYSWGTGDNWSGTFTGVRYLTKSQIDLLGGPGARVRFRSGLDNNHGSSGCNQKATVTITAYKTTDNNTDALKNNSEMNGMPNSRSFFTMNETVSDLNKKYDVVRFYLDGYYGLTSVNVGDIISKRDGTSGRASINGLGVFDNSTLSLPESKIKNPLIMREPVQISMVERYVEIKPDQIPKDGAWFKLHESSTTGSWFNYTIEQKRNKNLAAGYMKYIYYIRVVDDKFELLVNVFMGVDGDVGKEYQVQCGGKVSAMIWGYKKNRAFLGLRQVFSDKDAYSVNKKSTSARNNVFKVGGGSMRIASTTIENINTTAMKNPIIHLGTNLEFIYQLSYDHNNTCYASSTIVDGNLIKHSERSFGDSTGGGPNLPSFNRVAEDIDSSNITDIILSSSYQSSSVVLDGSYIELFRKYLGYQNTAYFYYVVRYRVINKSNGYIDIEIIYDIETTAGWDDRWRQRLSYSLVAAVYVENSVDYLRTHLLTSRPSGRCLELSDTESSTKLYVRLDHVKPSKKTMNLFDFNARKHYYIPNDLVLTKSGLFYSESVFNFNPSYSMMENVSDKNKLSIEKISDVVEIDIYSSLSIDRLVKTVLNTYDDYGNFYEHPITINSTLNSESTSYISHNYSSGDVYIKDLRLNQDVSIGVKDTYVNHVPIKPNNLSTKLSINLSNTDNAYKVIPLYNIRTDCGLVAVYIIISAFKIGSSVEITSQVVTKLQTDERFDYSATIAVDYLINAE